MFRQIAFLSILIFGVGILHGQGASPVGSSDGFVPVDGGKLYYQECGNGPMHPVQFSEGFST